MPSTNVTRIPRKGQVPQDEPPFVLAHAVLQKPDSFEILLEATEGSTAYTATIKRSDLKKLGAKAFKGTDEELEAALAYVLLRQNPSNDMEQLALSAEAIAVVRPGKSLTITLRQRIEDITPDLCTIDLTCDEDHEIQLLDWTSDLAEQLKDATKQHRELDKQLKERDTELNNLQKQLDQLTDAKKAHENELLEKARQLINSKKLKIRDQQRLLAHAKVDPSVAAKVKNSRSSGGDSESKQKPQTKRKAAPVKEESESGDGFDAAPAATDEAMKDAEDEEQASTPQDSDGEDTEEDAPDSAASSRSTRPANQSGSEDLPPRRDLPFSGREKPAGASGGADTAMNGADDDETDDEL